MISWAYWLRSDVIRHGSCMGWFHTLEDDIFQPKFIKFIEKIGMPYLCSIEHRIERSYFIYIHWWNFKDLGNLVHGSESEEIVVLLLGHHEEWNNATALVVGWEIIQDLLNLVIIVIGEVERLVWSIVFSVPMVHIFGELSLLSYLSESRHHHASHSKNLFNHRH
jgi:hypothetical protein